MFLSIALMFVFACGLGFLAALHAGTLVILLAAEVVHNTSLRAAALKAFERIVERFILLHMDFRHRFFPPSKYAENRA